MATYRPPRRYLRHYRRGNTPLGKAVAVVGVAAALAGAGHTVTARAGTHHHHGSPARTAEVDKAIAYARHRLGLPYCWGGTGPSCYDCSGLVMEAYASAGITIARTSQEQWATLPHVSHARPGDLVFYAGSDGTLASPGHVVLYIGHGEALQAYGTGYPVMRSSLASLASSGFVGYARPGGA